MKKIIRRLRWPLAALLMIAALIWPALWNGFPIVFYDTGGYLDSYMTGALANGRSALYGYFLRLGISSGFWANVIIQAAVVAWLATLTLRVHGLGGRPPSVTIITIGLATLTSLPWYAAQLMPDVWMGAGVLALYLLAFRRSGLRAWEIIALAVVSAFAIAGHMATLALMVGLFIALLLWRWIGSRGNWPLPNLRLPFLAVAAGLALILCSNLAITGRFAFIPGGSNFLFGRLIETGIAARYLADNCPDPSLRVCAYRDRLPNDGDFWLWDKESPLWKMGGWESFAAEARAIVLDSIRQYPGLHLRVAFEGTLAQLVMVKTGDYITPWTWHTHGILEKYAPRSYATFLAARQQRAEIDFTWFNVVHVPLAEAMIVGLPVAILLAWRRRVRRSAAAFALMMLLTLLGNAVICGGLSNPHGRYQSRLIWLAALALVIAAAGSRRSSLVMQESSYFRRNRGVTGPRC